MRLTAEDFKEVYLIISHDDCFWSAKDDGITEINLPNYIITLLENDSCYVLRPMEGALFFLFPVNYVCYDLHTIILPKVREKCFLSAKQAISWFMKNVPQCKKIITHIPEHHKRAMMLSAQMGMEEEGIIKEAFLFNSELQNLHIWGNSVSELKKRNKEVA
ncbi:MAG: hypothetical protein U9N86_10305 [Bacteroidota bacterium]|nr:hypothetical protein [Bacteroidota bacterium]